MPDLLTADELYTMVNLRGRSTGLPMNIWIGPRGHARHAARIKVQMDHRAKFDLEQLAVVGVEPAELIEGSLSPADLALVQSYVALNRQAILDHWNETTDGVELARALKHLRRKKGKPAMTASQNSRGRLIQLREAAERGQMSVSTLRNLLYANMGPPAFKRPGSSRWLFWTEEFDQWLESGRQRAAN